MASTDMKTINELDPFSKKMDSSSIFPVVVNVGEHLGTRKVSYEALKVFFSGYELSGVLTAGSTSITLSSSAQGAYTGGGTVYTVGNIITNTESDVTKTYICIKGCTSTNWQTDMINFVEISTIGSGSHIQVFTDPGILYDSISVENEAVTLTFAEQESDVAVKVRVS